MTETRIPREAFLEPKGFDFIRHHVEQIVRGTQTIASPALLREAVAKLARVILDLTDTAEENERTLKAMSTTIETLVSTLKDCLPEHEEGGCPSCSAGTPCETLQRRQTITNLTATAVMHTVRAMTPDRQDPRDTARIIRPVN